MMEFNLNSTEHFNDDKKSNSSNKFDELDFSHDYHSYANTAQVKVVHFALNLRVDFNHKQLSGYVELSLQSQTEQGFSQVILDTRDLTIEKITDNNGQILHFELAKADKILGQQLIIQTPLPIEKIRIDYHTTPCAEGLQWLTPRQTLGKVHPYLFSQSQPINARSWIPIQDSPKARVTFSANIEAPQDLRVVMSADNKPDAPLNGQFSFEMPQAIPTHLLAIACGDLAFGEIGKHSGIYTEPAMLESAVKEFEDTEQMIQVAESILGPYRWGRYDMIVLPPSFPFGGMENPRLAFMTPTLITGDKSLVSTVAHELAHSWTGNLVSNATWRDLWLNEGFTTYFTNRIVEAIYGKEMAELEVVLEYGNLAAQALTTPIEMQTVTANVQHGDPNDAFDRFTYDKASMFVHDLEHRLGRTDFDKFLFNYIEHFAFKAITTEDFVNYAKQTLLNDHPSKITEAELLTWIYQTGMPDWFVAPHSDSLDKVKVTQSLWLTGVDIEKLSTSGWTVHHWQYFLTTLPEKLTLEQLFSLDSHFNFTYSNNAEIAFSWFMITTRNHYDAALPAIEKYLIKIGRGKFVRPLYSALHEYGFNNQAITIYKKARAGYHPSIISQLDTLLCCTA